jgi:8-oxo-dGTP diphosphatase
LVVQNKKWVSAGGVVLPSDLSSKCFVIKPSNLFGPWSLPKGRVEPDETIAHAAVREVLEETGVSARILPNSYLGLFEGGYSNTHYFLMKQLGGRPTINDEVDKILLLDFAQAYDLFIADGNDRDAGVIRKVEMVMRDWG